MSVKSFPLPKTMKGLAMLGHGKVGWITKPVPECGPLDSIVRPIALAPCTSDIHTVWEGSIGERHDLILGHEAVGQVVKVGSEVKNFKPGDKVIVPAITPDWGSSAAQDGFPMHSGECLGGWKFSNKKDGVFAEYFHVNEADANLAMLPEGLAPEHAVMLCDMVTTGFHGAELADVKPGDVVAVVGIGPVGLMCVKGANTMGASRIFAIGGSTNDFGVAKAYGATDCINFEEGDFNEQILKLTGGKEVDKIILAGGDCDTFGQAVKIIKAGGVVGSVNYLGSGEFVKIPRVEWGVGMAHKHIHGGLTPGGRRRMERLASLISAGKLDTSKLLTHRFEGLEKVEEALYLMKEKPKGLIKPAVVINYNDGF